jgi:hypothetical protein
MMKKRTWVLFLFLWAGFLAGCASLSGHKYPTLIPTEYVPTAIALTVEAWQPASPQPTPTIPEAVSPTLPSSPEATPDLAAAASQTVAAKLTDLVLSSPVLPPSASSTPRQGSTPTLTRTAAKATQASAPTATVSLPVTASLLPASVEATPTPAITATASATPRFNRTFTPTVTPGISNATILLYNPGPMSKLTSPIQLSASLEPGPGGDVVIELLGEDGRILYRKLITYTTRDWVLISEDVEFSISAAAETARLQISTDDEQGRVMALASVDVLLLSMGDDDLNPPADLLEALIIREPIPNTLIQGGKVVVTGLVRTSGDQPLLIELLDTKGVVVGYRQAVVTVPADPWANQGYATFSAEVPYSVDGPTWVRLDVSAFEDRLPGPTHISSLVILLGP